LGLNSIKAVFAGTLSDSWSTSATEVVNVSGVVPSMASLAVTGSVGNYTLTAPVGGGGSTGPTGSVVFENMSNGEAVLATAQLESTIQGIGFQPPIAYATGRIPRSVVAGI
jgi:hypothetical protein